ALAVTALPPPESSQSPWPSRHVLGPDPLYSLRSASLCQPHGCKGSRIKTTIRPSRRLLLALVASHGRGEGNLSGLALRASRLRFARFFVGSGGFVSQQGAKKQTAAAFPKKAVWGVVGGASMGNII